MIPGSTNLLDVTLETSARDELEIKYESKFVKKTDFRRLVTYVPNKSLPVYNWFKYKEGFSRDLVFKVLQSWDISKKTWLLDPFAGVGTTLMAAKELGQNSVGIELLPSAVFSTRVKLRDYDPDKLTAILNRFEVSDFREPDEDLPDVNIIHKAFPEKIRKEIIYWRNTIRSIKNEYTRDLFSLALMSILESVSYTAKDGQFLRMVDRDIPPVKTVFLDKAKSMIRDIKRNPSSPLEENTEACIYQGDSSQNALPDEYHGEIGAIITSPPYLNRYDYSRIYSLELLTFFLDSFEELRDIRHNLLRSHIECKEHTGKEIEENAVYEILDALSTKSLNNNKIPLMIKAYFEDMNQVLKNLSKYLIPGAPVALVVANARFEGEHVPTDLILCELASNWEFDTEEIWITRYKGNSSQQMSKYGRFPVRESIIIWRKNG